MALADNIIPHEKRAGDRLLSRFFLKACQGFVVLSESVLADLHALLEVPKERALFLPHPIYDIFGDAAPKQASRQHLGWKTEAGADKYLLFFGFIRAYKGLDLLLEAMCDPRVRNLHVRLVVAGEFYEQEAETHAFIAAKGFTTSVFLVPDFIAAEEVKFYFCGADMVVQPYRTATQSGVTQIAYHFERPMLVTNVGGLPEIVANGKVGYVVEVNALSIADAIVDFYENGREDYFSSQAKEEKKRFLWDSFADGIEKLHATCKSL